MKSSAKIKNLILFLFVFTFSPSVSLAQDISQLGGDLSTSIPGPNGLQAPSPNIATQELLDKQVTGFVPFHSQNFEADGLGPFFVNSSCGGCHFNNGKGEVRISKRSKKENAMVIKVSLPGL
ncbi:MAG: hypothetical protein KDD56_10660, partial [Bdellovibrionales bacterium]|nr:hypothetical protein [Bdellovibrionales bacterium]